MIFISAIYIFKGIRVSVVLTSKTALSGSIMMRWTVAPHTHCVCEEREEQLGLKICSADSYDHLQRGFSDLPHDTTPHVMAANFGQIKSGKTH